MSDHSQLDDEKLVWLECYHIAVDALIAQPTDLSNPWTILAIKRGHCRVVDDEEAGKMNASFEAQGGWAKQYLQQHLAKIRNVLLARQKTQQ